MPSELQTTPYRALLGVYDKARLDDKGEPTLVMEKTLYHRTVAGVVGLAWSLGVKSQADLTAYSKKQGLGDGAKLSIELDIFVHRFCETCGEWHEIIVYKDCTNEDVEDSASRLERNRLKLS